VNGVCGGARYACSSGSSAANSDNGTTSTWNCRGHGGGSNAPCSMPDPVPAVNGVCGLTRYACNPGSSVSNVDNGTTSTWTCDGANGGSNASCRLPDVVNGACSTSTAGTCTAGTPDTPSDDGTTTTWNCDGANGGTNASCSIADPNNGGGGSGPQPCDCGQCPTVGICLETGVGQNVYCNGQLYFECHSYSTSQLGVTNADGSCDCSNPNPAACPTSQCSGF
jgi:hypothetical protein